MTYQSSERNGDGESPDRTQQFAAVPAPTLPSVGNGQAGGQMTPFDPAEAQPTAPFASEYDETPPGPAEDPRPPRDRSTFQLIWEALLVLLALNAVFLVYQRTEALNGGIDSLYPLAPVLLLVVALDLSIRFGTVNLGLPILAAVIASAPQLFVGDDPLLGAAWTGAAAAAATAVFCLLTLVFRTPAWLAGLAVGLFGYAWQLLLDGGVLGLDLGEHAVLTGPPEMFIAAGALLAAVACGLIGLAPGVRERMSRVKDMAEGGERRPASVFALIGATFAASALAAAAGFLSGGYSTADTGTFVSAQTLSFEYFAPITLVVLAVVALGGTSPRGRRGGVLGTPIALVLVWAVYALWGEFIASPQAWAGVLAVGLLLVGLGMASVLNRLGRPKEPEPGEEAASPYEPAAPALFEPGPDEAVTPR